MVALIECFVAQVAEMGVKGALECVHPAAGKAVDLFRGVWQKWQQRRQLDQMRDEVRKLANMTAEQVATEVRAKMAEVAPGQIELTRDLELYVSLVPAAVRQSLKRIDDPSGCSVPIDLQLFGPNDLVRLFPANVPLLRPDEPLPGLSSWTVTRLLGAGGFGEVWLATHAVDSARRSAVKFCTDAADKLPLIEHELKQVVRLMRAGGHPNLVPLIEYNLNGDRPWLMYEYVDGGTLTDRILEWQQLEAAVRVGRVIAALHELTAAVGHLHRLDPPLVHRDLKPANVLWCSTTSRFRVTDLGLGGSAVEYVLSAETNGHRSVTGRLPSLLFGSHSLHYASAEQRRGAPPDPRDDVHALGVIAYQMLTGKLDAAPGFDMADDLRDASTPDELIALIGRCVSQRADRRPKDANEVGAALVGQTKIPPPVSASGVADLPRKGGGGRNTSPLAGEVGSSGARTGWGVTESTTASLTIPLRGRWWSQPASAAKPTWKTVCDTPAEVTIREGEVYRLELPARVTDAELSALATITSHPAVERIVRLDLSGCEQLRDTGLSHLRGLVGVTHVNCYGCTRLTDTALAHLAALPRLTRLDLTRCVGISDTGLAHLVRLPVLDHLALGGCEWVTDAGLIHLMKLSGLKVLSVRGTQVTEAGAERLRRAVPGCGVEM